MTLSFRAIYCFLLMAFVLALADGQPAPGSTGTEPNAQVSKQQAAEEQAAIQWMRRNAIPLETVEAGNGFADLQALGKVVGNARIVELGEATHGTREFFQLKHRIIEYLATQEGFTIFSIEANMPEAYRLNDYVLHGVGDPKQLLRDLRFWTWNTQEVLDMILWMRGFNQSGKGRIEFTGFDMQYPGLSAEAVRHFVQQYDPAWLPTLDLNWNMSPGFSTRRSTPPHSESPPASFPWLPRRVTTFASAATLKPRTSPTVGRAFGGAWMANPESCSPSITCRTAGQKARALDSVLDLHRCARYRA